MDLHFGKLLIYYAVCSYSIPQSAVNYTSSLASARSEQSAASHPAPRLLDPLRASIRVLHYAIPTGHTHVDWIKRYIRFIDKQHPRDLSAAHVERFLSRLASDLDVAASTRNQAKSALPFLYKEVLALDLPWLDGVTQAGVPRRLAGGVDQRRGCADFRSLAFGVAATCGRAVAWFRIAAHGRDAPARERCGQRAMRPAMPGARSRA